MLDRARRSGGDLQRSYMARNYLLRFLSHRHTARCVLAEVCLGGIAVCGHHRAYGRGLTLCVQPPCRPPGGHSPFEGRVGATLAGLVTQRHRWGFRLLPLRY